MVTVGRRAQHKAATREALQDAARLLFEKRGYVATTVRDIASVAGVTERTFFRYFPSKEDLVLGEILDLIPLILDGVLARPPDEGPYTAVLNAVLQIAEEREAGVVGILFSGMPAQFLSEPSRPARPVLLEMEDGLARALAERLDSAGADPDLLVLRSSVLARASVAAMRSTVFAFAALPEPEQTLDAALDLVRHAFTALRDSCD